MFTLNNYGLYIFLCKTKTNHMIYIIKTNEYFPVQHSFQKAPFQWLSSDKERKAMMEMNMKAFHKSHLQLPHIVGLWTSNFNRIASLWWNRSPTSERFCNYRMQERNHFFFFYLLIRNIWMSLTSKKMKPIPIDSLHFIHICLSDKTIYFLIL